MVTDCGILLATGKRQGLLGSKRQRVHLSEAQFFCPGLQLLVSALVVGGETCAWGSPQEGVWGQGGSGRVNLLRWKSVNASLRDRWTQTGRKEEPHSKRAGRSGQRKAME